MHAFFLWLALLWSRAVRDVTAFSSTTLPVLPSVRSSLPRPISAPASTAADPLPITQLDQLKSSSSAASMGWDSSGGNNNRVLQKLRRGWQRATVSLQDNKEVNQWRLFFGSILASLVLFRKALDATLVKLWDYLLHSDGLGARIFRTDSWEWCWAISCFIVWIHAYGYADRLVHQADQRGWIHPWKKYRLQDRYEADKQRRRVLKRRQGGDEQPSRHHLPLEEETDASNADKMTMALTSQDETPLPVKHSKWNWKLWIQELPVYAVPLLIWDIVAPRRHRRIGGFGAPTTFGILGGVVGGLFLYDLLFFLGHVAMHKIPFLYRTVHAKHHTTTEVRACEIVRLGVAEEVLEVGFSIVALGFLSVHPVARTIYNAVITFLLTELHCGFDFPWSPQNVVPFGLCTGSRRHHYHHRYGKHYYQKFFCHVDRLFGCFQKNDGSLPGDSVQPKPYVPPKWQTA